MCESHVYPLKVYSNQTNPLGCPKMIFMPVIIGTSDILPVSSFSPNRIAKTLASVPAYFLSPVFTLIVYVVDIAVRAQRRGYKLLVQDPLYQTVEHCFLPFLFPL